MVNDLFFITVYYEMQLHSLIFIYKTRSFLNEYTTTTSAHNLTGNFLQKMRRNTIPTKIFGVTVVAVFIHEINRIRRHISLTDATASPGEGWGASSQAADNGLVVAVRTTITSLSHDSRVNA